MPSNLMIMLFVVCVLKFIAIYSVGRSHGGKFSLQMPSMEEIIYLVIIYFIFDWVRDFVKSKFPDAATGYSY